MDKEQQKDFNIKCAKFMGIDFKISQRGHVRYFTQGKTVNFKPYSDANDRNKVIEKMEIATNWRKDNIGNILWDCTNIKSIDLFRSQSMEAAQIACIAAVLESKQ